MNQSPDYDLCWKIEIFTLIGKLHDLNLFLYFSVLDLSLL